MPAVDFFADKPRGLRGNVDVHELILLVSLIQGKGCRGVCHERQVDRLTSIRDKSRMENSERTIRLIIVFSRPWFGTASVTFMRSPPRQGRPAVGNRDLLKEGIPQADGDLMSKTNPAIALGIMIERIL
jgi:hypothetical protein